MPIGTPEATKNLACLLIAEGLGDAIIAVLVVPVFYRMTEVTFKSSK